MTDWKVFFAIVFVSVPILYWLGKISEAKSYYRHRNLGGVWLIEKNRSFTIIEEPDVDIWEWLRLLWVYKKHMSDEDMEYFKCLR